MKTFFVKVVAPFFAKKSPRYALKMLLALCCIGASYWVLKRLGITEVPEQRLIYTVCYILGALLLVLAMAAGITGYWLTHKQFPENPSEGEKKEMERIKRLGKLFQMGSGVVLGLFALSIILILLHSRGFFGHLQKNALYYIGGLLFLASMILLFRKRASVREATSGLSNLGPKTGKLLMAILILGALFAGPLVWLAVMSKRDIWLDIKNSSVAFGALYCLLIPALGFAFGGKGAKVASFIITIMIYAIVTGVIYQKATAEEAALRRLTPLSATAKRWMLEIQNQNSGSLEPIPGKYTRFTPRLTKWDEGMKAMEIAFARDGAVWATRYFIWDKARDAGKGYWYTSDSQDLDSAGSWKVVEVGPDSYLGTMTCTCGRHTVSIKLSVMP